MESWSWYSGSMVQVWHKGKPNGWVATMPLDCPRCGLRWSDEGLIEIPGNAKRGWGFPPGTNCGTTVYTCCECGYEVYERPEPRRPRR